MKLSLVIRDMQKAMYLYGDMEVVRHDDTPFKGVQVVETNGNSVPPPRALRARLAERAAAIAEREAVRRRGGKASVK